MEEPVLHFFDTEENVKSELYFDFVEPNTYIIDKPKNQYHTSQLEIHAASTVSAEARLELLKANQMEVNLACQNLQPVIMDTGASLAITSDKSDFLPNTYQEITSLKLGGMW